MKSFIILNFEKGNYSYYTLSIMNHTMVVFFKAIRCYCGRRIKLLKTMNLLAHFSGKHKSVVTKAAPNGLTTVERVLAGFLMASPCRVTLPSHGGSKPVDEATKA